MLSAAAILINTIQSCKRVYRRWKNKKLLPNMMNHVCNENNQNTCCILDLDFSGNACIVSGPKYYHSCIEKTQLGLLFRILHYTMFDESDYGHIMALRYYPIEHIDGIESLYNDLCLKLPHIKEFIDNTILSLPSKQYNLITNYIGHDRKVTLRRKFNNGFFRELKEEKNKTEFPINFIVDKVRYNKSILGRSIITFGGSHWREIVSYEKPIKLDLFDIQSISRDPPNLQIKMNNN